MPSLLWWVQVVGGSLTIILTGGAILAAIYATIRKTPNFINHISGFNEIETTLRQLRADHHISQQLQLQQAEAFNDLKETVCEEHEIPEGERPAGMDVSKIRSELLENDSPDFTRGANIDGD